MADRANPEEEEGPEYFGVKEGRPFLVDVLPELNIIDNLVIDYMHNCLLGKILSMIEKCLNLVPDVSLGQVIML